MKKVRFFYRVSALAALGLVLTFLQAQSAFAASADDVAKHIIGSLDKLPGLLTAVSYMAALLFGVTGVLKIKEHVENPTQGHLRSGIIRLLAGGALIALPIVYEAMAHAINGGGVTSFAPGKTVGAAIATLLGKISTFGGKFSFDFNGILTQIQKSLADIPGVIASTAYLIGLVAGALGILKLKEHIENPDRAHLKDAIIRFLAGGALFAIPTVYDAMYNAIGGAGIFGGITSLLSTGDNMVSTYGGGGCSPLGGLVGTLVNKAIAFFGGGGAPAETMGSAICHTIASAGLFPAFLTMLGYLMGLVLGVWGVLKLQAHVLDPSRAPVHEAISRLVAGGLFFALPAIVEIARNTISPPELTVMSLKPVTGFEQPDGDCNCDGGLDTMLGNFMGDIFSPVHIALNFLTFCAGTILLMVGISRLMKGAQDGARGPGGLGTFMTFLAGGALISYNSLLTGATGTLFASLAPITKTHVALQYTGGMLADEVNHANLVITSILEFMIMVGLISFVRGIFIIREASEGGQQASIMAGVTHMVGGALAVNLGPLINAVEATLGLTKYGVQFS